MEHDGRVRPIGKPDLSRRSFLKGAGIGAAALAMGAPSALLSGCKSEAGEAIFRGKRTVTDDAGREVTIPTPSELTKIYYTSPLAQIYVFSLDPSKMAGTAAVYSNEQLEYLPPEMADLTYMGNLQGGTLDREMLIQTGVQLVFSISGVALSAANISDAENLQDSTGIPVVLVDGSFDKITHCYEFVGDIMGCSERANEISAYLKKIYEDVTDAISVVSDEDKVRYYYAEGPTGLTTEPSTSQHVSAFNAAGGYDVAQVEDNMTYLGMSACSLEDVIRWDPEVIIAWDENTRGGASELIRRSDSWSGIEAVKNGRVYGMPNLPFAWCDRPPGVNRWIGLQWMANMFYPDLYDVDMVEEAKKFYKLVYRIDVSDEQVLGMLGNSYPPYGTS